MRAIRFFVLILIATLDLVCRPSVADAQSRKLQCFGWCCPEVPPLFRSLKSIFCPAPPRPLSPDLYWPDAHLQPPLGFVFDTVRICSASHVPGANSLKIQPDPSTQLGPRIQNQGNGTSGRYNVRAVVYDNSAPAGSPPIATATHSFGRLAGSNAQDQAVTFQFDGTQDKPEILVRTSDRFGQGGSQFVVQLMIIDTGPPREPLSLDPAAANNLASGFCGF
jgi:hypothetical protein